MLVGLKQPALDHFLRHLFEKNSLLSWDLQSCDHRPPAVRVSLKQQKNVSLCFIKIALTTQSKSRAFYCLFRLIDLSTVSISGMSIYDMHVTTSTLRDAMDGGGGSGDKAHATDDDRNHTTVHESSQYPRVILLTKVNGSCFYYTSSVRTL